jgi:hypothetical protein
MKALNHTLQVLPWLLLFSQLAAASTSNCTNATDEADSQGAMKLKLIAIASILTAGAVGVLVPLLGDRGSISSRRKIRRVIRLRMKLIDLPETQEP